tara:strand:+ start:3051 stop:3590 length:540 start_codon:yes stop_codon:yes gene_type:complete
LIKIKKWLKNLLLVLLNLLEEKEKEHTQKTQVNDKMPTKNTIEDKGVNLLIIRDTFTDLSTIGKLYINGELFCDTLELPWRDNQRSISCIPHGEYKVNLRPARQSATRDYLHMIVLDVPNRSYILFHRGNKPSHTRGCILVGQSRQRDFVGNSTLAMNLLMKEIINLGGENIKLIIKNR